MTYRSQGVPLQHRIIREDADRFHPMSDGADFQHLSIDDESMPSDLQEIRKVLSPIAIEENSIYHDCNRKAQKMIDDFIDKNPDRLLDSDPELRHAFRQFIENEKFPPDAVPVIGTAEDVVGLMCENDRLRAEIESLKRELEYQKKSLQNMTESRDDWKGFAQQLVRRHHDDPEIEQVNEEAASG